MDKDIPPLELQFYAQLPQSIEELCGAPRAQEQRSEAQELERLTAQIQHGTMSTVERQKVRVDLLRLLSISHNGIEEKVMTVLHALDKQTPPEELGERFWVARDTAHVRAGP